MSTLKVGSIQPNSGTKVNITGSTLLITTASGHFSGSYEGDGSRLSGVDGLPYTGSGQISGSLLVTGSGGLALRVSGSTALTGSLFVSGTVSGSFVGDGSGLTGIDGYAVANSSNNRVITSVDSTNGNAEANLTFDGSTLGITGDATLTGTITAATGTFVYQYFESSSTIVTSGSNIFGNDANDIQQITGSLKQSGSAIISGSLDVAVGTISGSFRGDGSNLTGVGGFPHTGSADITGSLIVTGSAFVTSLTETSAERFKTNITNLDSQIDNISLLTPVSFNWKEDNREDIGLIAEQIHDIYPEFIGKNPNGEIQGIKYSKLTAVLVKSIQELNDKNKELELRINELENK